MPEDNIHERLIKLETTMETMSKELVKVNANLKLLTDIQVEQVRAREETQSLFKSVDGKADRAHERLDRVENNLSRGIWVILTVIIVATLAQVGFAK